MYTPSSLEEIQDIIQKARENGKTVRALGSGHCWNEMGVSNDIYISLHNYRGIVSTKIEEKWGMLNNYLNPCFQYPRNKAHVTGIEYFFFLVF